MMEGNALTKAIIKDGVIRCGRCRHKIAESKALRIGLGNGTIYFKCKHKDAGKRCNCINQIDL